MAQVSIPLATYRFQLHAGFPLREATKLLPYLRQLGVLQVYCSPLLQAVPGSTHGYDCADHKRLNLEIASPEEFEAFAAKLKELQMSVLLDIVPNHGALHPTNPTLMDVLESGRSSAYAHFFDINWSSARFGLASRILLPVLGTHLCTAVEKGEVKLTWHEPSRTFAFTYYSWVIPADPVSVARFLLRPISLPLPPALLDPLRHLAAIPTHCEGGANKRQALMPMLKQRLADCVSDATVHADLVSRLAFSPHDMLSLLNEQPYRLAYWRSAASEINYRRFFDINELIALRMEDADVFDYTHALPLEWLQRGIVSGLRIDHPDGLANPQQYFERLQQAATQRKGGKGVYVLAEKILSSGEEWQRRWPTHGTTGYEFMNVLTGVFVDTRAEDAFTQRWMQLTGINTSWPQMARHCKRMVLKRSFESDLNRSTETLHALLACGPPRDWTTSQVRRVLIGFIAALPVYRTYIGAHDAASASDAAFINEAVRLASQCKGIELELLHALADVFLTTSATAPAYTHATEREELRRRFVTQLQQLTGAVMAKGCEDTAFYRYLRLTALNEVGGDPGQFGTPLEAFHKFNTHRSLHWPAALSSVSTHDTKRGSDARLRLAVLSEMSDEWFRMVHEWMAMNEGLKCNGYPQANEEQFLYQTVLAAWEPGTTAPSVTFVDRIEAYMMKASKEAKLFTSWTEGNETFETALKSFIRKSLANQRFLASFVPFVETVHHFARLACVSHTILHIALPGVPDVYQGTELWDLSLVDPDNRRPPNWEDRQAKVQRDMRGTLLAAVESDKDGWSKMWTLRTMLALRKRLREVFEGGSYTPATITGPASERIVAFERKRGDKELLIVVARFFAQQANKESTWNGTTLKVHPSSEWMEHLSGTKLASTDSGSIAIGQLFAAGPWAVLERVECGACANTSAR